MVLCRKQPSLFVCRCCDYSTWLLSSCFLLVFRLLFWFSPPFIVGFGADTVVVDCLRVKKTFFQIVRRSVRTNSFVHIFMKANFCFARALI